MGENIDWYLRDILPNHANNLADLLLSLHKTQWNKSLASALEKDIGQNPMISRRVELSYNCALRSRLPNEPDVPAPLQKILRQRLLLGRLEQSVKLWKKSLEMRYLAVFWNLIAVS